ncbi:hypothetical protein OAK65_01175 [Synechococcus sp. AH-551-N17]|nr:hypothetical protein [Synechococcus sp. AH-551-N17]
MISVSVKKTLSIFDLGQDFPQIGEYNSKTLLSKQFLVTRHPMNSQIFAHNQQIAPLNDDAPILVNGGWLRAVAKIAIKNSFKFGQNAIATDAVIGMAVDTIS